MLSSSLSANLSLPFYFVEFLTAARAPVGLRTMRRAALWGMTVNDRPTWLAAATRHHDATSVIPTLSQPEIPRLRLRLPVYPDVVTRI